MKKTLTLALAMLMLAMVLLPACAMAANNQSIGKEIDVKYAWIKTGNGKPLNLRDAPTKNSNKIGELPYRTKLVVLQELNGWSLVEEAAKKPQFVGPFYVMSSFLTYKDPGKYKPAKPEEPVPTYEDVDAAVKALRIVAPYKAVIKTTRPTNFVHLRWIPNTSARFIDKYLCNTEIIVLAQSKTWAQVQIVDTGYVGFILRSCVDPLSAEGRTENIAIGK